MRKIAVLLAACLALVASCGPLKKAGQAAKDSFIDCAKEDITRTVKSDGLPLLGEVVTIVGAGGQGWQDSLTRLGAELGENALACAVEAARIGFASAGTASLAGPSPAGRAAGYAKIRGWKFSNN